MSDYKFHLDHHARDLRYRCDLPNGMYATVELPYDECMGEPWKEHDGYGDVSEWTNRDKRPGERILCTDHGSRRYYDFAGAIAKAKKEGWGLAEKELAELAARLGRKPTNGEVIEQAVERDFDRLKGWCDNDWHWVSVHTTLFDADDNEIADEWCGGVEDDTDYWQEIAADHLNGMLRQFSDEQSEIQYWAERDVATV